ncbi:hypothetical protein BKA62DRAFT_721611 [Auriculariales sp. MPI-PUGE-AT-0066]|nr:hypothetical protein BKA62DRAFT_721611 [Auriculariales sp. MPI-PUGE-AT-0066]
MALLPHKTLNAVFGTMLIATWFNSMLLGLELTQLVRYFREFPKDSNWIRAYVVTMVCVDMVCMYGSCGAAYTYLVIGWGDLEIMEVLSIHLAVYDGAMAVGIIMVHAFLIRRYLALSRNRIVSLLLCVPALTAFILGMIVTYLTAVKYRKSSERPHERPWVTAFFVMSAIADTVIAAVMMHQLHRLRSSIDRTDGLVLRLMRNTALSGAAPCVLALASFIAFLFAPLSNVVLVFTFNISRAGTLTVLYNLNDRKRARAQLDAPEDTVIPDDPDNYEPHRADARPVILAHANESHDALDSKNHAV